MRKPSLARTKEVLSVVALALAIVLMSLTLVAGGLGVTMLMRAGSALSELGDAPPQTPTGPTAPATAPEGQPQPTGEGRAPSGADGKPEWCANVDKSQDYIPAECE
jgi:hypothetical protein